MNKKKIRTMIWILMSIICLGIGGWGGVRIMDLKDNQTNADSYSVSTKELVFNGTSALSDQGVRVKDGVYYAPLTMLQNYLGWSAEAKRGLKGFTLELNGHTLEISYTGAPTVIDGTAQEANAGAAYIDGNFYISMPVLDGTYGCHVLTNQIEGSERAIYIDTYTYPEYDYSWMEDGSYIAHAMGGLDGYDYTESLEAFLYNYEKGYRVFEVDFQTSSDGEMMAVHSWTKHFFVDVMGMEWNGEDGVPLSSEEFLSMKVQGKYTTLSFTDVLKLMQEYPDVYIVLDTKDYDQETVLAQYSEFYRETAAVDEALMARLIPQIYSEEMLDWINSVADWNSIIYSLYQLPTDFSMEQVINFSYQNGIKVVTMGTGKAKDLFLHEMRDRGIYSYVHTINDVNRETFYRLAGVYGIYTDVLN